MDGWLHGKKMKKGRMDGWKREEMLNGWMDRMGGKWWMGQKTKNIDGL